MRNKPFSDPSFVGKTYRTEQVDLALVENKIKILKLCNSRCNLNVICLTLLNYEINSMIPWNN